MVEIKGFIRNTLLDWDGKIASIIFLPGCNFRCPYCHASALVKDGSALPAVSVAEVDSYLEKNRAWIDGVVISGGEATFHNNLPVLVDHLRERGLGVKLFTNGSRPAMLHRLVDAGKLSAISMDVKGPLDERYSIAAGTPVDLDAIRESIGMLKDSGIPYEFRTTVCPAVLKSDDVIDTARDLSGAELFILQQFRPVDCLDPEFERVKPYRDDELDRMAALASQYVKKCVVVK